RRAFRRHRPEVRDGEDDDPRQRRPRPAHAPPPGATLSRKLASAMERAEKGQRIEIWTEDDFHERLAVGREALEAATRAQRVAVRSTWLPSYVVDQARAHQDPDAAYWPWLRATLRHPDGAPSTGEQCLRCIGSLATTCTGSSSSGASARGSATRRLSAPRRRPGPKPGSSDRRPRPTRRLKGG